MNQTRRCLFLKPVSTLLIFSLLFSQTAWADVRQMIADAQLMFDEEEALRPHGMAANDLAASQQSQEEAVAGQQTLADLQALNFSLKTQNGDVLKYIGDRLDSVERPDGTELKNIVTDAAGNIVSSDLKLADGSIQVLRDGAVIGWALPDGRQVIYENGKIKEVISPSGVATTYSTPAGTTDTVLDSPQARATYGSDGKLKTVYHKATGQTVHYANGMIDRAVAQNGAETLYQRAAQGADTLVVPVAGSSNAPTTPTQFQDAQGNIYHFDADGSVASVTLADGSALSSIVWNADGSVKDATLTQTDGARFIFQDGVLTRSFDPFGVVTNYAYFPDKITTSSEGNVWEYLPDGTPVRFTSIAGDSAVYLQSGPYQGLKDAETVAGVTYTYAYQGSGATLTAQRTGPGSSSAVLPVGLYDTLARSTRSDGSSAWMTGTNSGIPYLLTWWGNAWVDYSIGPAANGNLQVEFQAVNSDTDGLPAGYTHFQIEVFVDGVSRGVQYVPAHSTLWQDYSFTLDGVSAGSHTVRFKWLNDAGGANGTNANFKFRGLKFTQAGTGSVETVTGGFQAVALSGRVWTLQNSGIVKPSGPASPGVSDFQSILYDSQARPKEIVLTDGARLLFADGLLTQAFDASGSPAAFQFDESELSNLVGTQIVRGGLTSNYDADGRLEAVVIGDLTVHFKADTQAVDFIEKADGTELWDLAFDASGVLTDAAIYVPGGEERRYQAGKLVSVERPDRSKILYANDKPAQLITPESLTYDFTYSPTAVQADLQVATVPDALTPVRMEYDLNFNLKKVTRQNQEILNYLNDRVQTITTPGAAGKVFNYATDAQGNVISYTVTQDNVVTTYDVDDNPISAVIGPTADNPATFDVSYSYGRIREIKKNGVVVFRYAYSVDADGSEIAAVEDLEENALKTYAGGNLVSSLDHETQVLTAYEYVSDKVSRVTVSRFGRMFHDYVYAYDGDNTVVTDEEGIVRTYGPDENLLFMERDGEKFAYSYDSVDVEIPGGTAETVLPVGLYDTSARSVRSNGSSGWMTGSTLGSSILYTYWNNQYVDYSVSLAGAGDLRLEFDATNISSGGPPPGYPGFKLEIFVDGQSQGVTLVPAYKGQWQHASILLQGLSTGAHSVRIKWINDASASGTDANFGFGNLKFTQVGTGTATEARPITTERLVEKRLEDGTLVRYAGGRPSQIDYADGKVFKDFVLDESGAVAEATLFQSASDPAGTTLYFEAGRIAKARLSTGQELEYSYDTDANGALLNTWVKKGAAHLKYDSQNNLVGLRIDGVMSPDEILAITTHSYTGGNGGFLGHDGNPDTAQTGAFGGGTGNSSTYLIAEHDLPVANAITAFSYRLDASAFSGGDSDNGSSAFIYLETKDAATGLWTTVPGTYAAQSHSNGGGGGSTAYARTSGTGLTTIDVDIPNVIAVRAHARASAYSNTGGSHGGQAFIYEVQFTLADESSLEFNSAVNATGQDTGYSFSGYVGTIGFDAIGNLTQTDVDLAAIQQELMGVVQNYVDAPYLNAQTAGVLAAFADNETVTAQEYSEDGTLETQAKADGTVTLFENGKPSAVLDARGERLIEYSYDAAGNPSRIHLKNARDTLPDLVAAARLEIEQKRAQALKGLAAQKNLSYQSIEAQFQNARIVLDANLGSAQGLYDNVSSVEAKGKEAKGQKADALNEISDNIVEIQGSLASLYDQEADAYAALDAQVRSLSDQIEADSQTAFAELGVQETQLKREILRQEVSPIVYDYYRRILGRDPSTPEYENWVGQIDYNSGVTGEAKLTNGQFLTQALQSSLNASPELAERQTYVNTIKASVTTYLMTYAALPQSQKEIWAASFGLAPTDLVPLSSSDISKILGWINSRSLHFGQSAFLALEALLDQKGIFNIPHELATRAILIDVLSGVISPLDDGDLVISVFALNKTAKAYGLDLVGANLSWSELKAAVPAQSGAATTRVIAHINGNHFVVVTSMTDDSITYVDPGIGKDRQNESVTVTKEGFLKAWQGNVALEQSKAQAIAGIQTKTLTAEQTKGIRGAFWGSLLGFVGSVLSWIPGLNGIGIALTAISAAISAIEGDWISSISSLVTLGLGSVGDALKGAFDTFVKAVGPIGQIFSAGGQIISSIYGAVTGLVGDLVNTLGGFLKGFGLGAKIATNIARTAVSTGLGVATSKGLEAVGVNPEIAGFAGSLAAGLAVGSSMEESTVQIMGKTHVMASQAQYIRQSLSQVITLNQVGQLGTELGLDPAFSQIIGLSIGAIQGAQIINPATSLEQAFSDIKPQIQNSLIRYGVEKAGESLGLDPRLSPLVSFPVAATLSNAVQTGQVAGQNIVQSINQGLGQGIVAYGLDLAGLDDSAFGSLQSANILNGIESSLGIDKLFGSVFKIIQKAVLFPINIVGGAVKGIVGAIQDFGSIVSGKGLPAALEENATSIFDQNTLEEFRQSGGVQNSFNAAPRLQISLPDGRSATEIKLTDDASLYTDTSGNLLGKRENDITQIGTFAVGPDGTFGLLDGNVYADIAGELTYTSGIQDGQVTYMTINDAQGEVFRGDPEKRDKYIRFEAPQNPVPSPAPNLNIWGAVFTIAPLALALTLGEATAKAAEITVSAPTNIFSSTQDVLFALVNGIFNEETDPNVSPDYINNFESDISASSNGEILMGRDFMKSAIYQSLGVPGVDHIKDIIGLLSEATSPITQLASVMKIMFDFDYRLNAVPTDRTRPIIAMGYSGGFLPLIEAIRKRNYNTETLIGLGAATTAVGNILFEDLGKISDQVLLGNLGQAAQMILKYLVGITDLTATNVQRIVNVWGTEDILKKLGIAGKRVSIGGITAVYNIEIEGATHFDYMRRSDETDPVKADFNRRVSKFVADLTVESRDDAKLLAFLQRIMVAPDVDGVWRFHP